VNALENASTGQLLGELSSRYPEHTITILTLDGRRLGIIQPKHRGRNPQVWEYSRVADRWFGLNLRQVRYVKAELRRWHS
jgi:hypothetical protein